GYRAVDNGGEPPARVFSRRSYDTAAAAWAADAERTGATPVPAFDHTMTIAGQGTVTREIVNVQGHPPDVLVVPVGGGGILAGGLSWLREQAPGCRVVGVEPAGAASMAAALSPGGPCTREEAGPVVGGWGVR